MKCNKLDVLLQVIQFILINILILNSVELSASSSETECLKIHFKKQYLYYSNGDFDYSYDDDFFVYVTSRYYKIESPLFSETVIYDDRSSTLSYIFTDKKVYMTVNPSKEPAKKKTKSATVEKCKLWNTGYKQKYKGWDIELWRKTLYGVKESEIGLIDISSYYAFNQELPQSYYNYHVAEEKIYSSSETLCDVKNKPFGLPVFSSADYYDKSKIILFKSIEQVTKLENIQATSSLFEIPKDYKKVEWNPDLFKH
jgi:hypothetical protein